MENLTVQTRLLDYSHPAIQHLINVRGWKNLSEKDRIREIYNFVRDEIDFGYNACDNIRASHVLADGYGQCNTKGTLFMALLRAVGISCRMHAFLVDKKFQKGTLTGIYYKHSPTEILHSWVEIFYDGKWFDMEGFILDTKYITAIQNKFANHTGPFYAYAIATKNLHDPQIYWDENDTYIQRDAITKNLGVFGTSDELFSKYKQKIGLFKTFVYRNFARHAMNKNVKRIRESNLTPAQ